MSKYKETIHEIRRFNRFYTVSMGFLDLGYLDTRYSIAETRILFELKVSGKCIQSDLTKILHIDKSYLSRIIKRFEKDDLIERNKSNEDKRASYISLTEKGRVETEKLIKLTNSQIETKINSLNSEECRQLRNAMETIISILWKGEQI